MTKEQMVYALKDALVALSLDGNGLDPMMRDKIIEQRIRMVLRAIDTP